MSASGGKRLYSFDVAKGIASFLVIAVHTTSVIPHDLKKTINGFYRIHCNGIFMIITGYFSATKFKYSRLFSLFLITVIYNILNFILKYKLGLIKKKMSFLLFYQLCNPFINTSYWFNSTFILAYIFIPSLLTSIKKNTRLHILFIITYLYFSYLRMFKKLGWHFGSYVENNVFVHFGYSFVGSYIRFHNVKFNRYLSLLLIFILPILHKLFLKVTVNNVIIKYLQRTDYDSLSCFIVSICVLNCANQFKCDSLIFRPFVFAGYYSNYVFLSHHSSVLYKVYGPIILNKSKIYKIKNIDIKILSLSILIYFHALLISIIIEKILSFIIFSRAWYKKILTKIDKFICLSPDDESEINLLNV